jgi:hypothetical protein
MAAKKTVDEQEVEAPPSEARTKFLAGEISWHSYCQAENAEQPDPME